VGRVFLRVIRFSPVSIITFHTQVALTQRTDRRILRTLKKKKKKSNVLEKSVYFFFNPLTPNDHYSGRTASLTSKRCILDIYSTSIGTEYFKHGIYSPLFSSSKCSLFHNSNVFGSCIIHILYTECAKIKKIIPAPKG